MARQRRVFPTDQVAHIWAQQKQDGARNPQGNFYFEGTAIYSYRRGYPVGNFVQTKRGERAVLLWDGRYSVTTSRHQRMAENATRGMKLRFAVPDVLAEHYGRSLEDRHESNVKTLTERVEAEVAQTLKASHNLNMNDRKYTLGSYGVHTRVERIKEYCKAFGVKVPAFVRKFDIEALRAEYDRNREAAQAKRDENKRKLEERLGGKAEATAYRERKALLARASALLGNQTKCNRLVQSYCSWSERTRFNDLCDDLSAWNDPKDKTVLARLAQAQAIQAQMREVARAERERREQQQREYEARQAEERAKRAAFDALPDDDARLAAVRAGDYPHQWLGERQKLEMWRNHEFNGTVYGYGTGAALRVARNGTEVETSRGARFPVEHARLAWRALLLIYAIGVEWQSNGHTIKLGHFSISRVSADGTITAGCHTVTRAEAERLAATLGF